MQERHRKVECDVCNKLMRSDTLKRHKETHKDLFRYMIIRRIKKNWKLDKKPTKSKTQNIQN